MEAIRTIKEEHRSLAAVLHGMLYLVHRTRARGDAPNFAVLGAMIYYIDAFPERFHHPKEDRYLFRLLRIRYPGAAEVLDRLKTEHRAGAEKIRTLEQALARYQQGGASEFPNFLAAVEEYAAFHWAHMKTEEQTVLPLAETYLTAGDWEAIDAAFAGHTDPMLGIEEGTKYEQLFRRITWLAPEPIGLGQRTDR
ncbi:MAG: hemerythrin domain-containing protein [Casimicrobiaceae bacterium]